MLVPPGPGAETRVPVLCDLVGVIGSEIALLTTATGQWSPWTSRRSKTRPCVAWSPPQERPERVTFATDLIGEALDADGGAS